MGTSDTGIRGKVLAVCSLLCLVLGVVLAWQSWAQEDTQKAERRSALVMTIDGAIGPAISDYFTRGLREAEKRNAEIVIVEMNTPGGLDASMRDMISAMLGSPVPVAIYVSPSGSRAASAGTYLMYGSHVAAMAPATHLGSATPVQIGGGGGSPFGGGDEEPDGGGSDKESGEETTQGEGNNDGGEQAADEKASDEEQAKPEASPRRGETAMERKVLEDAVSYIRSLAERHDRNADWAEAAVREAVNLTSNEALERNVIDVVASDINDLLAQIDGREVVMDRGEYLLQTADLTIERFDPDWRTKLLAVITNPNVAYFLMIIGFYGLIFELSSPGSLVPGTIGIICLLLALFAFQVLPINFAGLALIVTGMALIVGEALMPSFGILGIGGIIAFVIGSVILMDAENLSISIPMIGGIALLAAILMLWTMTRFMGLRKRKPRTGQEELLGSRAVAVSDFQGDGRVRLHGELWKAHASMEVHKGDELTVVGIDGLTVEVASCDEASRSSESPSSRSSQSQAKE
ncbi:serine protease [Litchfieldella qijiaojingensis]|uniref:Serine protease n=1 Tax=Litchfieldella qijiaojingensis TaxID=980347 RepID=A0ABQ2YJN9_9GAMM|nr:nodulation protein NfeD [Halomonas qijiaojingensis]GGX86587.1 serine protease [Halomonas qijiaojingensis]